jgi:branched-chain amino acid transport system ATP-binding protein
MPKASSARRRTEPRTKARLLWQARYRKALRVQSPLLKVRDLHKSFGGVKTLTNVSFDLDRGQVLGLIGPNGAGKTTVFNIISGIYTADRGEVFLEEHAITNKSPSFIARRGVSRTFQVARTFNDMTVDENLRVGLVRGRLTRQKTNARIAEILELTRLGSRHADTVAVLPDGQKKLLEVARAIVIEPKVLILDEPFAGVGADVIDLMISIIHDLASRGVGCLAISHDIASMPRLSADVLVLVDGQVMTRGTIDAIRNDARVVDAYLGA